MPARVIAMDAAAWDARYAATSALEWGAEPNRWVAAELAGMPPGRAADLAAGEGRNALWLAGLGWRVTAVDFSAAALAKGRDLGGRGSPEVAARVGWECADVRSYTPDPGAYDLVLLSYLQLPAPERRDVVRGAAAALAPGGTLLVIGHDTTNLTEGTGGPQDPAVLFTPADVVGDLDGVPGLAVERAERVYREVGAPPDRRRAVDALVRIRRL
jgi:SAM-dependent methyltransferase